jgi:polysaccharide biosynthesis/export protein
VSLRKLFCSHTNLPRNVVVMLLLLLFALTCQRQLTSQTPSPVSVSGQARSSNNLAALAGITGVTDEPIFPGEVVSVAVPNAPDFSTVVRVSQSGDVALPYLGIVHLEGLNSASAATVIEKMLMDSNLAIRPRVLVTVDAASTGITVLGEVRSPGVYQPSGKHMLSDVLAMAGGLTANTGRIIEISTSAAPEQKTLLPWDPTMHNTTIYDRVVQAGSRILVKPCGVAYVGGNVAHPGIYPICASQVTTVSQLVAMAGGHQISSYMSHTILVRTQSDGSRVVQQIDINKVVKAQNADPVVREDDIIFVPLSGVKYTLRSLPAYLASFANAALNVYAAR